MDRIKNYLQTWLARQGLLLVRYAEGGRRAQLAEIVKVRSARTLLLNPCEAAQLMNCVAATRTVPGAVAEVGVASGASARLIATTCAKGKTVHLFDTFAGLPDPSSHDSDKFHQGQFGSSTSRIESVRAFLAGLPVVLHPGFFPDQTGADVRGERFSFVHLDMDLYEGTLRSLEFFYPRLNPGAILLCHDYLSSAGVDRAFAEFFAGKPEPVVELTGYYCMVVKLA